MFTSRSFGGDARRCPHADDDGAWHFGGSVETTFGRSFQVKFHSRLAIYCRFVLITPSKSPVVFCMLVMRSSMSLFRSSARTTASRVAWARPAEHIPAASKRLIHTPRTSALTRPSAILCRTRLPSTARFESSAATPPQSNTTTQAPESRLDRDQVPSYELTFTCNVCKTRSSHRLSKQGYHKGTILISCPGCKNRHLISDHLKVC